MKRIAPRLVALVLLLTFAPHAIATPATSPDRVITAVSAPAAAAREVVTKNLSTTPAAVFADLSKGQFGNDAITQNVTIESETANTVKICAKAFAIPLPVVVATDTCAEVCAASPASAMTCSKASTDGEWIDPGETLPGRDTGAFCWCAVAASGTPTIQAKRLAR